MHEEELIIEVQKHQCIYDIFSANYKDTEMCQNAWSAIASVLGNTTGKLMAIWTIYQRTKHYTCGIIKLYV